MTVKINIQNIQLDWLNTKCLVLISKFARILYKENGEVIKLQQKNVLRKVVQQAKASQNFELNAVYRQLKKEIQISLCDPAIQAKVMELAIHSSTEDNADLGHRIAV